MGRQPRRTAARSKRAAASRIRQWIVAVGLQGRALMRSREGAQTLAREALECLGVADASDEPLDGAEGLLRARQGNFCGELEPGEAELMANVEIMAKLLELNDSERDVLALFAAIPSNQGLQTMLERIDVRSRHQAVRAIALILGHDTERIRGALSSDGALVRYHIVNVAGAAWDFSQFSLLNDDLERALSSSRPEIEELLSAFFTNAPAAELERADYEHLEPRVATLIDFLRGAERCRERGVNVLFYGIAGTGKTELARLVARELGWRAYEVKTASRNGNASTSEERMMSYCLAQRFLDRMRARLVIFDELEDVLAGEFGSRRFGKLFMNRLLERNMVPTIWIANDIEALDLAMRRRFDFSISFGPLPGVARRRVLERHLTSLSIDGEVRADLLRCEALLPAQVATGRKVARLAGSAALQSAAMLVTVEASMRLLGQAPPREGPRLDFDATLCNADIDIASAIEGLVALGGRGTVCLYGPPGAGKSALAGHLAERLGRRAVRVGPTDVLSAFLGENEQRVARVFEAIDVKSEILVLEEVDELLAARNASRQSWEVRLANEVLMRIDGFGGLTVLTTNNVERLDAAALRRCDLKVRLSYLSSAQCGAMWERVTGTKIADGETAEMLLRLDRLTAGDFVTVAAQARLVGRGWGAADWVAALAREQALKPQPSRAVGFVSSAKQ